DFVDVEQLGVNARHRRRRTLVVIVDKLYRTAEQAALLVGLFLPDFHAEESLLAIGGKRTGQRHAEANSDRFTGLSLSRRAGRKKKRRRCAGCDRQCSKAPCNNTDAHLILPEQVLFFL